ncbi:DUF4942 domain-containing protein [Escherichia coli]|uniref:DUF4942 domain-containing protein n=1 Tax=Escherichia coli TaxID=562 RepID=UPI0021BFD842|nr:DUF4942 domain-containing protein [Escherichia coli]
MRYNGFSRDNYFSLNDFENIVCLCYGENTPVVGGGKSMYDRLQSLRQTDFTGEVTSCHGWKCRLFANGNVHIIVGCESLLNALNNLISVFFENQLPARGKNDGRKRRQVDRQGTTGNSRSGRRG